MARKGARPRGLRGLRPLRRARSPREDIARLRGAFLAWMRSYDPPAMTDLDALWDDVLAVVDLATARAGLSELDEWTVEQIHALHEAADAVDEHNCLLALPLVLAFLGESGRWRGTPDEFDRVIEAAEEVSSPVAEVLAELAEVRIDPEIEDAAVRALPVIARGEALLRLVSPRRQVTGTGALRRADVVTALERLGAGTGGRRPHSMWDVPGLADLWIALQDAGLLVVTAAEATPTPLAHGWISGDPAQGRQARLELARRWLDGLLTAESQTGWFIDPLDLLLPLLATAATGRAVPVDAVLNTAGDLIDGLAGDDAAAGLRSALSATPYIPLLEELAEEGFLELGEQIAVPAPLRGVVAAATAALLEAEQGPGPGRRGAAGLPAPDPSLAGQAYRLRIELAGARPPIWREVLVDPATPLDELHDVIQRVFAWDDSHLHEFTATGPGRRETRYAPDSGEPSLFGPPPADEAGVRLSRLIGPGRGVLTYRYDFGDCWDHQVTVAGSQPAGGTALPSCTGGSGAAPLEDSGGVWGWAEMLGAAHDPRHPEHGYMRESLGLAPGQAVDPRAFDPADADRRLADLRSRAR